MKTSRLSLLSACLIVGLVASASGQESGFQLPNFNPFGQKQTEGAAPTRKKPTSPRRPLWEALKMSPSGEPARPARVSQRMQSRQQPAGASKDLLTRTREFFMPWSKLQPDRPQTATGTRRVYSGSTPPDETPPKKKGIFSSLWPTTDLAPERPKSATDFLSQPRVGFGNE